MAPRMRDWSGEGARVQMVWPKALWKDIQHLALEEDTTATALMIEAARMLLAARRKEGGRRREKKK